MNLSSHLPGRTSPGRNGGVSPPSAEDQPGQVRWHLMCDNGAGPAQRKYMERPGIGEAAGSIALMREETYDGYECGKPN